MLEELSSMEAIRKSQKLPFFINIVEYTQTT